MLIGDKRYDAKTESELLKLLDMLNDHETIQRYHRLENQVQNHSGLNQLIEDIKSLQKEIVHYDHYDKPNAKKEAIQRLEDKQAELDTHPLVIGYKESLAEANDLLQYITDRIQMNVNQIIEDKTSINQDKE